MYVIEAGQIHNYDCLRIAQSTTINVSRVKNNENVTVIVADVIGCDIMNLLARFDFNVLVLEASRVILNVKQNFLGKEELLPCLR